MSLAVTGTTGFVGQALLDAAARARMPVRALTRRPQERREGVEWIEGDLSNRSALAELTSGTRAVIHIAGLTNTPDPQRFEQANVAGTASLIEVARSAEVERFVFVSSLSAREPKLSAYGASKARAEEHVAASGLDWTIVRPPAVYGPRDRDMFELFRAARAGVVPIPPRGRASLIHVDDLAECLLALVPGGEGVSGAILEPDDGRPGGYAHRELAQAIGRALGRERVFAPHLPAGVLALAARADRLLRGDEAKLTPDRVGYMCHPDWAARSDRRVPDAVWHPRIVAEEGLAATAAWYRAAGWL